MVATNHQIRLGCRGFDAALIVDCRIDQEGDELVIAGFDGVRVEAGDIDIDHLYLCPPGQPAIPLARMIAHMLLTDHAQDIWAERAG